MPLRSCPTCGSKSPNLAFIWSHISETGLQKEPIIISGTTPRVEPSTLRREGNCKTLRLTIAQLEEVRNAEFPSLGRPAARKFPCSARFTWYVHCVLYMILYIHTYPLRNPVTPPTTLITPSCPALKWRSLERARKTFRPYSGPYLSTLGFTWWFVLAIELGVKHTLLL